MYLVKDRLIDLNHWRIGKIYPSLRRQLRQRCMDRVQSHLEVVLRVEHSWVNRPDSAAEHDNARVT